jgi:aminoglycoside 6'-N-acetyltransferase
MKLRPATPADIPTLERWDTKAHVIACTGADDAPDWAGELEQVGPWYECLIGEVGGRPVGVVQIIDPAEEPTHYWGDCGPGLRAIDIWIGEEADLGHGLGTLMMGQAIGRCFAPAEVRAILIDPLMSNVRAQVFYRRLGFEDVGTRRFGEDDCLVMRLERSAWAAQSSLKE